MAINNFYFKNKNGVVTLHCKAFDDLGFTKHCFTTRLGGVSTGYLSTMNLSFSRDSKEAVEENLRRVNDAVGFSGRFMITDQEHTDNVVRVDSAKIGHAVAGKSIDGLITDKDGICLTVYVADCVPIIIIDPIKRAAACVHSGWRGTAMKISKNAVAMMQKEYGSDPSTLVAAIGPCIHACCYEVGGDVLEGFCDIDPEAKRFFMPKENGKFMLDLSGANCAVLEQAGLLRQNIHQSNECTCCKSDLYFSHRATKGKRGNIAALIEL